MDVKYVLILLKCIYTLTVSHPDLLYLHIFGTTFHWVK